MRKIEQLMNAAIENITNGSSAKGWSFGNTIVTNAGDRAKVFLHGNHIADVFNNGKVEINVPTLCRWNTPTTRSRLNALGAKVNTRKGTIYVDGVAVN